MNIRQAVVLTFAIGLVLCGVPATATAQSLAPAEPFHTILLVRHAAYASDSGAGPLGPPLNSLGIAQARIVATRLAGMPGPTDALISSTLVRAHQTAMVVADAMPEVDLQLNGAVAECRPRNAVPPASAADAAEESACTTRLDSVFAELVTPSAESRRTIVVAHGNVIRYLAGRALGIQPDRWQAMNIGHTSITRILVGADGVLQVITVGDVGHLPANMQSGSPGLSAEPLDPL